MDKYEYNLKIDQMKELAAEENYDAAADIVDTISWSKVKNVNALVKAGEIYEKVERYEEARELYLMAYDRSPIGRMIIYRLAEVSVKMKDFLAAGEYYREFVEIAPKDNMKYVLRYEIRKAEGAELFELIKILQEYKEQEFTEEWGYELAYLYHKAGDGDHCVEACDELILWFGEGPYVERALELKMLYQPLTKAQEEKYRRFRLAREGVTAVDVDEVSHTVVEIPQVTLSPERFNTVNLQEEIAKGMQQIMDAQEQSTVTDTMDSIKKIVEDIPYLQIPKEEASAPDPTIPTDEEIDGSLRINFQELLSEEPDGQVSMVTNEQAKLESQITGQMTIAEILEEWEKTKRAAEAALAEAQQQKLDAAKARALQEAGDIMERLNGVIPKLDAGVTPRELLEEEYMQREVAPVSAAEMGQAVAGVNEALDSEIAKVADETAAIEAQISHVSDGMTELSLGLPEEEQLTEENPVEEEESQAVDLMTEPTKVLPNIGAVPVTEISMVEMPAVEFPVEEVQVPETPVDQVPIVEIPAVEMPMEEAVPVEEIPQVTAPVEEVVSAPVVKAEEPKAEPVKAEVKPLVKLTEEQKAIFSYFVPITGMEAQLCKAISGAKAQLAPGATAKSGNIIIAGGRGCGKTTLATSLIKVLQQETGGLQGRVGKMEAEALNKKDVASVLSKVQGGCLIIEGAGELTAETEQTLSDMMEADNSGLLVILEDSTKGIRKAFEQNTAFAQKFTETIIVPNFKQEDLMAFAMAYAKELGYEMDEMAQLAMINRIRGIEKLDQATTISEVKEIVDEAIAREGKFTLKKYFSILTAKRYSEDDYIILQEEHFIKD